MSRLLPRTNVAILASMLALMLAAGQVMAGPTGGSDIATGGPHKLADVTGDDVRERISGYQVINSVDDRELDIIIGSDDRQQVTNTTNFPNSAVAYIEAWHDDLEFVFLCTASFVGPNVLLTAAHCVWVQEFGGWPDGIVVAPGLNGSSEPFGFDFASQLWAPEGWIAAAGNINQAWEWDYALIVLDDSSLSEATGAFTINVMEAETLSAAGFQPSTAGYPADKPWGTQWFGTSDAFVDVRDRLLVHDIDAFQGQSGSPVWRGSDLAVAGVVSFETTSNNYARRITGDVMSDFNDACQVMGCAINQVIEGPAPPTPTEEPQPPLDPSPSPPPTDGDLSALERTWSRTDDPVQNGLVSRTWMWGPAFTSIFDEPYDEAPGGMRTVLYHEKSRMEITYPDADSASIWYVTNGLIAKELVTGRMQVGDNRYEDHAPAAINVAGDADDSSGPTYATFLGLLDAPAPDLGSPVIATVGRSGAVGSDPALAALGVTAAQYVPETNHVVASVFWAFMNGSGLVYDGGGYVEAPLFENPYFATGLPITEPYWTTVQVGGTERTVLVQVFERRVLTYTPGNPPGWDVEAGNVGLHYYLWRYGAGTASMAPSR